MINIGDWKKKLQLPGPIQYSDKSSLLNVSVSIKMTDLIRSPFSLHQKNFKFKGFQLKYASFCAIQNENVYKKARNCCLQKKEWLLNNYASWPKKFLEAYFLIVKRNTPKMRFPMKSHAHRFASRCIFDVKKNTNTFKLQVA